MTNLKLSQKRNKILSKIIFPKNQILSTIQMIQIWLYISPFGLGIHCACHLCLVPWSSLDNSKLNHAKINSVRNSLFAPGKQTSLQTLLFSPADELYNPVLLLNFQLKK